MRATLATAAFLLSGLFASAAHANDDPKYLIQSCQELVSAYSEIDQMRTIAKFTTGISEALRAGYCIGRVDEYRHRYECASDDWYEQAEKIAAFPASSSHRFSVDLLLEASCES